MDEDPLVRVVRGEPGPAELAALVTVLLSRSAPAPVRPPVSVWARSARPGSRPTSWRTSARPR